METTKELAKYVVRSSFDNISPELINEIKRLVLDWIGVAVGGSTTETGKIMADYVRDLGGKGESTVVGYGYKVPSSNAAFANAVQSHSIELDDVDHLALFHYSPPVVSSAIALSERDHIDGETFLTAITLGCEVMNRLSDAINPSHRDRGFHTTATCGTFGAACAAGKILNLDEKELTSCFGLAGAQTSGLMEFYGVSMQKRLNPGVAARNGITAALLAKKGFTGSDTILEGKSGFCRAFSDKYDLEKITCDLGSKMPIYIEFKAYACARPIHTVIDCALKLIEEKQIRVDRIKEIIVRRHPSWANYHVIYEPRTYHEAQVSLPYSVAVAIIDGRALLEQYSEDRIHDKEVLDLAKKIKIIADDKLHTTISCKINILTKDNYDYESELDYIKGSKKNPMTDEELRKKFEYLASRRLTKSCINEIIKKVNSLEKIKDINELCKLLY